ncbi:MAG: ABC transporter substrate-binding protein [Propionibacteriaceae bacterium]|nr:ABC transporter substrate-binding protein [Propionibacteriaceae bacterium]
MTRSHTSKTIIALVLGLGLTLLSSCTTSPTDPPSPTATTPVSFTDDAGRTVEVPAPSTLTRVSPSGALSQMFLMAIAPDLMVSLGSAYSASDAAYIPPDVAALPAVGELYGSATLNYETVAALHPQLVVDVGEPKGTIVEDMDTITANLAVPAVHITATLTSTPDAFRELGRLLGREDRAEQLASFCEQILAQSDDVMAKVGDAKLSAVYLLGSDGLNVIPKGSYHAEVLDEVTTNIAVVPSPSSSGMGNQTDLEQINVWNPDVILFAPASAYPAVTSDPAWSSLSAIKDGQYYETPEGPYNWFGQPPSINRYLSLMWLTKLLYPQYATFDLRAEVTSYYSLFYGHTLTPAEYATLTERSLPQ